MATWQQLQWRRVNKQKISEQELADLRLQRARHRSLLEGLPGRQPLINLKNIHQGRRAFIIGTGPSLLISDLDQLKDEITFGCNKIYLAFDQTDWRPSYYFVLDRLVAENNKEKIRSLSLQKFLDHRLQPLFQDDPDAVYIRNLGLIEKAEQSFSKDPTVGAYCGGTVLYHHLQMAYYMGIREVYLLGVDFHFTVPSIHKKRRESGGSDIVRGGPVNHFHPDYRKSGEEWFAPKLEMQRRAFRIAKETFKADGGKVLNASRKSWLRVFPRVKFDQLMRKKQ